jgi:hypothetical protein
MRQEVFLQTYSRPLARMRLVVVVQKSCLDPMPLNSELGEEAQTEAKYEPEAEAEAEAEPEPPPAPEAEAEAEGEAATDAVHAAWQAVVHLDQRGLCELGADH